MGIIITEDNGPPSFTLHGVELGGSFDWLFKNGKWEMKKFHFQETKISGKELKKLADASKAELDVVLKLKNGNGKARIGSLYYEPISGTLKEITIELVEWDII